MHNMAEKELATGQIMRSAGISLVFNPRIDKNATLVTVNGRC